ncbi:MAG: hypothetical protein H6713_22230 [Myxococcales bacterium]|nr:hypothetical protein [Myxococcales bacterium]
MTAPSSTRGGKLFQVRSFDYVVQPYDLVRDALSDNALAIFQKATQSASDRVHAMVSELHVDFRIVEFKVDVSISVGELTERSGEFSSTPYSSLKLEWEAAESPRLFPLMEGELSIFPVTPRETQLNLLGHYKVPFGTLGQMFNAIIGRQFAEASVHRFLRDVAEFLGASLER